MPLRKARSPYALPVGLAELGVERNHRGMSPVETTGAAHERHTQEWPLLGQAAPLPLIEGRRHRRQSTRKEAPPWATSS